MAQKGFRNLGTLDPTAQLIALLLVLTVSYVFAESVCTLSMTSSTTVLQQVSLDISCSGSATTSTQPHVWIDSNLNPHLINLTGEISVVHISRAEAWPDGHSAFACLDRRLTKLCVRTLHIHSLTLTYMHNGFQ